MPSIADLFISVSSDVSGAITGLTEVDQRVNGVSQSMQAAAPAGLALAGAAGAIGAGFLSAIDVASSFQQHMSNVAALLDPSQVNQFSGALTTLAMRLGQDTVFSSDQAATAIGELLKAGVDVSTVLDGGAAAALSLAAATGTDIPTAATFAGTALNTFHESADQLGHTVDVLTGVANSSAASIHDLQMAFASVGPVAASLGLSFDDTATALGVFANNGLNASDAGTSLRTMLLNLEPSTRSQVSAFEQLGLYTTDTATGVQMLSSILQAQGAPGMRALTAASSDGVVTMSELYSAVNRINPQLLNGATSADAWARSMGLTSNAFFDASGNARSMSEIFDLLRTATANLTAEQRTNLLATAFGTDAVRAATIAATEGADGFNRLSTQVQVDGLAAQQAGVRLNNLSGDLLQMGGSFETVQITIGNLFLPVLRDLVETVTAVENAFISLARTDPALATLLIAIVGITGAVSALIAGFILLGPVIGATVGAFGIIGSAIAAVALPITLVIAAVALLYAAWQDNFGGIRDVIAEVWVAIQPALQNIQNFAQVIGQNLASAFQGLSSSATPLIEQLSQALAPILAQLPGAVRTLGDALNVVGVILGQVADVVRFLVTGDLDAFMRLLLDTSVPIGFVQVLTMLHAAFDQIGPVVHAAFDAIGVLIGGISQFIGLLTSGDVQGAFNSLRDTFGRIAEIMLPAWQTFLSWLGGELAQLPGFIGDRVHDLWNALLVEFGNLPGQLAPYWSNFLGWLGGELGNLPGFIGDAMGNIWGGLAGAFDALIPLLQPYWDNFASWFGSILGGIPQFVVDSVGDVFGGLVALFAGLIDVLAPYWDAFAGWFLSLLQGIPQFVIDNAGDVFGGIVQAAIDLAGRIASAIDPIRELLANTLGNLGGWITSGTPTTGTATGGTPLPTGGTSGPVVSIGTLIISSQQEANDFLNLVAQAVLASANRVTVPTTGANPVLG